MLLVLSRHAVAVTIGFFLLNIGLACLLVWITERSRLAKFFQRCAGIAPPFVSVMALLFGLYSVFLANDVSSQRAQARAAVAREADALQSALDVAQGVGSRGAKLGALIHDYGAVAATGAWYSGPQLAAAQRLLRRMRQEVLFGDAASAGAVAQHAAADAIDRIADARRNRVLAALSRSAAEKWSATFFFGILTLIALVLVHLGRARAAVTAAMLFALAMTFSLLAILGRIEPFAGTDPISLQPIQSVFDGAGAN